MQLLILSCNKGEGHNSCAKAIAEYFTFHDASCQIIDSFRFISKKASQFISDWHSKIYRHAPSAFSHGYKFAEEHSAFFDENSAVYHFLTSGTNKLSPLSVEITINFITIYYKTMKITTGYIY